MYYITNHLNEAVIPDQYVEENKQKQEAKKNLEVVINRSRLDGMHGNAWYSIFSETAHKIDDYHYDLTKIDGKYLYNDSDHITIKSNKAFVDNHRNKMTFSDKVIIKNKDVSINADNITLDTVEQVFSADGGTVRVGYSNGSTVDASKLLLDRKQNIAIFSGNVKSHFILEDF
jgi:hypothetical protein